MSEPAKLERYGSEGECVTRVGVVRVQLVAEGSKQEHRAPILVQDSGEWCQVHQKGDNPFRHESIMALEGRRVAMEGSWVGKVLVVQPTGVAVFPAGESDVSGDGAP